MELSGVFLPATTPFDRDAPGDADLGALRENLGRWLAHPVAGVVLFGSTGEGPLLEEDEKARLVERTRDVVGDRILLAGTGAESTRATIRATRAVAAAGADGVMVQPPAYFRPAMTPDALRDHYAAVADASPIPVMLYQVPPRFSTVELPASLVHELSRHPNITGIKDSSGDLKTLSSLVDACEGRCAVLAGAGSMLLDALEAGAAGGVVAVGLLDTASSAEVYAAFREGRMDDAREAQARIAPLHRAVVAQRGVSGVKAALEMLGMHGGPPRPPLRPLPQDERLEVWQALVDAALLSPTGGA